MLLLQYISYHGVSDIYHFAGSRSSSSTQRTTDLNQGLRHLELKHMLEANAILGLRKTTEYLVHYIETLSPNFCSKELFYWTIIPPTYKVILL